MYKEDYKTTKFIDFVTLIEGIGLQACKKNAKRRSFIKKD